MKKRTETLQADKEFVKTYDDSKFEKPSVTKRKQSMRAVYVQHLQLNEE